MGAGLGGNTVNFAPGGYTQQTGLGGSGSFGGGTTKVRAHNPDSDDEEDERKVGSLGRSGREIIHISVGKAGCGMGHEFLRDLCEEHKVDYHNDQDRGKCLGTDSDAANMDVFFNEGQQIKGDRMRWVPRTVLVDLNMQDLASITSGPLGHLYKPESIIGNDEGSSNCYAKAFHLQGADIADDVLELARKESERCNCLQGVQFTHSIAGGTGSGLTGLLLRTLREFLGQSAIFQTFSLVPAPNVKDITLEPYNAALGFQDLDEVDQCFLFDNFALQDIVQRTQGKAVPKQQDMNNIVALCMSGLTSSLRFKGPLNADLWKMNTNLVPFKQEHYLISSFAPLVPDQGKKYRKQGCVLELAQQMLMKENVTVHCDPLNPGDATTNTPRSRILASWAAWRGNFKTQEVDDILFEMSKTGSRFDQHYPDWIPNPIASNICKKAHSDFGESVVYVANNTAVGQVFAHSMQCFDNMFNKKSFMHHFSANGVAEDDLKEARNTMEYIKESYRAHADKEDKIIKEGKVNDRCIEHDDHRRWADELKLLMGEEMELRLEVRGGRR